ncbi:MAG TPA: SDR family NAD(P)-dependent oxidoreductase [Steroidobacteraceae bacterium]|jgi:NAD(P)-dependent dehydrogenase (short-subunit alcohol dehydrogenase family)|nr:SDR family NAD(P)-dependent oxidoreductase [Steroidobacteraceae bacterium]
MRLDGSVAAVITGGASGLGAATARALATVGVRVTLFDLHEAQGRAFAAEIGGCFVPVDVCVEQSVAAGFAQARAVHGQERILVNCAGILAAARTAGRDRHSGAIRSFPMDVFERVLAVNLTGTFRCITHAAAGMLSLAPDAEGERGVIINTASIAAQEGQIGQAAYAASKGGVLAMTVPVARDLAAQAIRVNVILPGVFDTPMLAGASDATREGLAAAIPFPPRLGRTAEFASLVVEICRNAYLNAAAIRLDGALRMTPR